MTTRALDLDQANPAPDMRDFVERGLADEPIDREQALAMLDREAPAHDLLPLAHAAGLVRRHFFGRSVQIHMLHNVQCGACPEDCGYCGQAKTSKAPIQAYRLKSKDEIIAEAERARDNGAFRYCMVLSGRGPSDADIDHMAECVREVKQRFGLETCVSAGLTDQAKARRLKDAGLDRLNHNLNTSQRHYPRICTTHTYDDRRRTLHAARGAGLQLCSGLIVGMDESIEDLVDVAFALREVRAESVPVNFLLPIPGNRIAEPRCAGRPLTPEFCVRVLCTMRLVNPSAEVRIAAGREKHLRSLQPLALEPANSLFIEGYLLTKGGAASETVQMIRDAGFEIELAGAEPPDALRRALEETEASTEEDNPTEHSGHAIIKDEHVSQRKLAKLRINGQATPEA